VERCRRDPKPLGTTRHGWIVDRLEHPPRLLSTCSTSCGRVPRGGVGAVGK
jgi:hypothetical protein